MELSGHQNIASQVAYVFSWLPNKGVFDVFLIDYNWYVNKKVNFVLYVIATSYF